MRKIITQKLEYCVNCNEEIAKGDIAWYDEFYDDEVLCDDCYHNDPEALFTDHYEETIKNIEEANNF